MRIKGSEKRVVILEDLTISCTYRDRKVSGWYRGRWGGSEEARVWRLSNGGA
jgi:hypothetical protein